MSKLARVTNYRITPASGRPTPGLRIAVLADLHSNTSFTPIETVAAWVHQTNALNPDLALLLGDYAGHVILSRECEPTAVAKTLAGLKAPLGVHAVFGNHDWYSDPEAKRNKAPTKWHRAFKEVGISCYSNSCALLDSTQTVALAGLESQRAYKEPRNRKSVGLDDWPSLHEALDPDRFTILMAHEPDIFPDLPDWVDLTLSGHTHGGQIAPFGVPLIVPSNYGRRYAYGHFQDGKKQLVVSGGLGYSLLPLRLGRPPEIVLLEIG